MAKADGTCERYEEASSLIRRFANTSERVLSGALRPAGLTPAQYEIMALLESMRCGCCGEAECRCDSSYICQNELGAKVATTKGNVSGIVQRLVEDGLISREMNPRNRRENSIRITANGRAALFAAQPLYEAAVVSTLSPLNGGELDALCSMLGRLLLAGNPDKGGEA